MTARPHLTGEVPLVGREGELDRIVSALVADDRRAFLITGPAGAGKSRLAVEAARAMEGKGATVAQVFATSAAQTIPFGAFAPLLPEVDGVAAESDSGMFDLLRRAGAAIASRRAEARSLLLVVDDAHLLDAASATLLQQLTQQGTCHVVASVRTPDPRDERGVAPWHDLVAERIDLAPLDEPGVQALAEAVLEGPVAASTVRWLWEASAGNAMFVRELLLGASATAALDYTAGVWFLHLPLRAPDRLAELVADRLTVLAPASADVVDLLAIGEPLGFDLLESIAGNGVVEEVERSGLVAVREVAGRWEARLSHPVYADVRRQRMPRARLRRLSRVLAQRLVELGATRRDEEVRIARLQVEAGVTGDPELLARAAQYARLMQDLELAARLAQAALAAGGGVAAGLALAEAQFFSGRHQEAEQTLSALGPHCASDVEIAQVAHARCYNLGFLMGDRARAEAVAVEALALITTDPPRWKLLSSVAFMRAYAGEIEPALEAAVPLLECGVDDVAYRGAMMVSLVSALAGRTQDAIDVAARGFEIHVRCAGATQLPESQLIGAVLGHRAAGQLAEAERVGQQAYDASPRTGHSEAVAAFILLQAMVAVDQGRLPEAVRMFGEAAAMHREVDDPGPLRWCLGGIALAEGMSGNAGPAREALAALDAVPPHWMSAFDPELIDRGRAWAQVADGAITSACEALVGSAARAGAQGQYVAEARLLHDVARLGQPARVAARLAELARLVDGELVGLLARHAAASARADRSELQAVATRLGELGAALLAAEICGEVAQSYRRDGLARLANAWELKVADLAHRCGAVRTPGLAKLGTPVALTPRENEIVALVMSGRSSREIAEQLVLSRRTVENHLQRAFMKLGVSRREQLVQVFAPQ